MTEFEFLSVPVSMIFGLGLTHVLAGTMRHVYVGLATEQRLVYSLFARWFLAWPDRTQTLADNSRPLVSMRASALIVLAFLGTVESAIGAPADDIRSLRTQSNAAIARHDVEAVVSFLDADYQITVGNGGLFHGRAGEPEGWRAEFARAADLLYVRTPESVEVSSSGQRAAEIGVWVGTWTAPDGQHRASGRYAAHWSNVNGSWKIRSELFVTLSCEGVGCS